MVEEDARAAEHPVRLAVLPHDPVAVELRHRVGAVRVEGGVLVLRNLLHLPVELRGRRLVDAAAPGEAARAPRLEDAQDTRRVHVRCELGGVERHLNVALSREVVDLVGPYFAYHLHDAHRVTEVRVVEVEAGTALKVSDALAVVHGRAPDGAVDVVALLQEEFRKVRAVLARDAGYQRCLFHFISLRNFYK